MDEMMEETRGQSVSGEKEETGPGLLAEIVQVHVGAESGRDDELAPPDWLEPLDEECGEAGKQGVQNGRSGQQDGGRNRGGWRRRGGRRKAALGEEWVDCSELGNGWKKKVVYLRTTSGAPKQTMIYTSPKGFRVRSKKELKRRVKVDVTHFDFKQGIFVDGVVTPKVTQRRSSRSGHSLVSSSTADTPDNDALPTQDSITKTTQKQYVTRKSLAASATVPLPSKEPSSSPLQLNQVSPSLQQAPQPSLSPSLGLGDFSPQIVNNIITPEKENPALPSRSWLQSPLAPVSPAETPAEKNPPTFLSSLNSSPAIPLPLDADALINGEKQENGVSYNTCANCGSEYSSTESGAGLLCSLCTLKPRRRRPPHMIFKKVGQDKWVVGKRKSEGFLKKEISPLGKKSISGSVRSWAKRETEKDLEINELDSEEDDYVPDGDCDGDGGGGDDDDDDDQDLGPKKRKRRMCGQCKACLRTQDCGRCDFCKDKPKFGGDNKKRQKCRLRQCKFRSRLMVGNIKNKKHPGMGGETEDDQADQLDIPKRNRPRRKRINKSLLDEKFTDDEHDDNEDAEQRPGKKGRKDRKKWRHSLKLDEQEEDDLLGGPDDLEKPEYVIGDDGDIVFYEEVSYSPSAQQNGSMEIVESSESQPALVMSSQPSQDWLCSVAGLPEGSQVLGSVNLNISGPLQLSESGSTVGEGQTSNILTSNPHLNEVINTNWLNVNWQETAMPQVIEEQQSSAEPAESPPLVLQTHSLLDDDPGKDNGLLELLTSLRRTVLPAHWVGVMAKGPFLQLLQCSKLSPMADTVLQIEKDFYYQINVQNQPLLLTHPIYERHPPCLTSSSLVVTLLLDLEEMNVCQGYQSFEEEAPNQTPLLCARAALCQLLIPADEECCDKCLLPTKV